MTRDQALKKIRKLISLAQSSNPNESAIAFRQAQALMREHGIGEHEAQGIEADATPYMRGVNSKIGEARLALTVCEMFGALHFLATRTFEGSKGGLHAYQCVYTFTVLSRQMRRDTLKHLKLVRVAKNRAARGDTYQIGWVQGLRKALDITTTAIVPSEALQKHFESMQLESAKVLIRQSKAVNYNDYRSGADAGAKAKVNKGFKHTAAELEHLP